MNVEKTFQEWGFGNFIDNFRRKLKHVGIYYIVLMQLIASLILLLKKFFYYCKHSQSLIYIIESATSLCFALISIIRCLIFR